MQVSVTSATRRHVLNEPLSSPLCCAAQGRHHSPHSCFLCSFYKFLMSVLKEPASRTWEMGNKSLLWFYSFSAPCDLWCVGLRSLGTCPEVDCGWAEVNAEQSHGGLESAQSQDEKVWYLGRVSVLGIWRLPGALKVPCRRVCSGGSGWSWVIWVRVWPACWGRGTGACAVKGGCLSLRLGWASV